jgi:hypothetical protein
MSVNFRIVREQGNFSSGMYDVWQIVNKYKETKLVQECFPEAHLK